jgi:transcription initiation factor TFIIIB Brf1 subunit/transcription initiation factor TFIIB
MSSRYSGNNERNGCPHTETIDDDQQGECICLQCGLVLEPVYQTQVNETRHFNDPENDMREIDEFLKDVGEHAGIPLSIINYTEWYFQKIKKQLLAKKKFKDKDIASYALYETLCRHKIPRTVQEIIYFTSTTAKQMFAIESELNIKETLNHPLDYCDRFCSLLGIDFWDGKIIKGIVFNMFGLGNVRPQSVVALVVYLYCKEKKLEITLTDICEVCSVSASNIYKLVRENVREPYRSQITLLYT